MATVHGVCDSRFKLLRDAMEASLASGDELGASIAIDLDGETVVDLWGGWRDEARSTNRGSEDTIVNVWSTTKTVTSLAMLMLVARGDLDVYAPVARYWPEFAAAGKEAVEVRHLLSHTSGVSGLDQPAVVEDLYDWETSTSRMAAQAPWWEPGTASGYHALNYGHLLGEVLRRITGMHLKQFVAEEIAGPLGADFQIGAATADSSRISARRCRRRPCRSTWTPWIRPAPPFAPSPGRRSTPRWPTRAGWRAADIGGANGHGNARSVARMLSAVTLGGQVGGRPAPVAGGHRADLRRASPTASTSCWVSRCALASGTACLKSELIPYVPTGRVCFWGGWGGSVILMDLDRRMTFAYMMNKMAPGIIGSDRAETYVRTAYAALDVPLPPAEE